MMYCQLTRRRTAWALTESNGPSTRRSWTAVCKVRNPWLNDLLSVKDMSLRASTMKCVLLSFAIMTWCFMTFVFRERELAFTIAIIMLSAVRLLSVCLWRWCTLLRRLNFSAFFSPYDSSGTLLFWCQKSLVGDAPFSLKFAFKVTHPLSNSAISTNIGS